MGLGLMGLGIGSIKQPFPNSWTQSAWFIDPVAGNDQNTGKDSAHPLKTWGELSSRWGTCKPVLRQNTTITFLSSHVDNSDPVIFAPFIGNGAKVVLQGNLDATTKVASGTLASVTAKNRSTPQLLQANLGASAAVGQLVHNTTHNSYAWIYKLVSGTTFSLSQPLAPVANAGDHSPAEVDTWTNTDAFDLYTPVQINIALISGHVLDFDGPFDNFLQVIHLTCFDPAGAALDNLELGSNVVFDECRIQRLVAAIETGINDANVFGYTNCYLEGGIIQGAAVANGLNDHVFEGGILGGSTGAAFFLDIVGATIDSDTIIDSGTAFLTMQGCTFGTVYLASGTTLNLVCVNLLSSESTNIAWGAGTINVQGQGRLCYAAGAGAAVAAFKVALKINGDTTATSVASNALHTGITLTAANLDAAAGAAGFGGLAFNLGGGCITNGNQ